VLGLCGGYQMLGREIADPEGIEGPPATVPGLGLLDVRTVLAGPKWLAQVAGRSADGVPFTGYEMHMGRTEGPDCARPFAHLDGIGAEGAVSADGCAAGSYVHGLFAADAQRSAWLEHLGAGPSEARYEAGVESALEALAAHLAVHLDLDVLLSLAG
jgi:adenosylcobyric acid synthase